MIPSGIYNLIECSIGIRPRNLLTPAPTEKGTETGPQNRVMMRVND